MDGFPVALPGSVEAGRSKVAPMDLALPKGPVGNRTSADALSVTSRQKLSLGSRSFAEGSSRRGVSGTRKEMKGSASSMLQRSGQLGRGSQHSPVIPIIGRDLKTMKDSSRLYQNGAASPSQREEELTQEVKRMRGFLSAVVAENVEMKTKLQT